MIVIIGMIIVVTIVKLITIIMITIILELAGGSRGAQVPRWEAGHRDRLRLDIPARQRLNYNMNLVISINNDNNSAIRLLFILL